MILKIVEYREHDVETRWIEAQKINYITHNKPHYHKDDAEKKNPFWELGIVDKAAFYHNIQIFDKSDLFIMENGKTIDTIEFNSKH